MWRNWKRLYAESVHIRITSYFLLILLPLVAMNLYAQNKSQLILKEQAMERTKGVMQSAMQFIDTTFMNVEELSDLVVTDSTLNRHLDAADGELMPMDILNFQAAATELIHFRTMNRTLSQTMIFHTPSSILLSDSGYSRLNDRQNEDWVRETVRSNGSPWYYIPVENQFTSLGNKDLIQNTEVITLMRLMTQSEHLREPSIFMASIRKEYLYGLIGRLADPGQGTIYLFTPDGRLAVGTPGSTPPSDWDLQGGDFGTIREGEQSLLMVKVVSTSSGWSLLMLQPQNSIFEKSNQLRNQTYVITAISLAIAVIVAWFLYRGISFPMRKLIRGMKEIRLGRLDVRIEHKRSDEFGYMMGTFNEMMDQQRFLIRDIYDKELRIIQTELKLLQSQINPHFLYNTLDSIYSSAILVGADQIGEMVLNLSKFFRISIGKGKEVFTMEETVVHLGYYINVQQLRFKGRLQVDIRVDNAVRSCMLLKLILQPLVENAIVHGLEQKSGKGQLNIEAYPEQERLHIRITDNGSGITPERLLFIQNELGSIESTDIKMLRHDVKELFGLRNVKTRLILYYGDQAELHIDSVEQQGTVVLVTIPLSSCVDPIGGK
jgi:two-component system sensor histidine kinase YesM